jgi:hypothetical protein
LLDLLFGKIFVHNGLFGSISSLNFGKAQKNFWRVSLARNVLNLFYPSTVCPKVGQTAESKPASSRGERTVRRGGYERPHDDDDEAISVFASTSYVHRFILLIGEGTSAEADWALIVGGHHRGRSSFNKPSTLELSLVSMGLRSGLGDNC